MAASERDGGSAGRPAGEPADLHADMFVVFVLPLVMALLTVLWGSLRRWRATLTQRRTAVEIEYFSDPVYEAKMDSEALRRLTPNQQEVYFQAKEYVKLNGHMRGELPVWMATAIEEKGVSAWEFVQDEALTSLDESSQNSVSATVDSRSEITFKLVKFTDSDTLPTLTLQTNHPIPLRGRTAAQDTFYIEYKLYNLPDQSQRDVVVLSLGLATCPYPSFVLPGRFPHSISYDSTGMRNFNQPFAAHESSPNPLVLPGAAQSSFPKLQQGDVVGMGVRIKTKSVFFTRNGKRVSESKLGGHACFPHDALVFPTVGISFLEPLVDQGVRVSCNFGQAGYVFIEGNVKKWGLGNLDGNQPPPPKYERWNHDVILESTDDEGPPLFESSFNDEDIDLDFDGAAQTLNHSVDSQSANSAITLDTLLPNYENLVENDIKRALSDTL